MDHITEVNDPSMTERDKVITIPTDSVTFVKELYPRLKPNDEAIERYRASIGLLPPIVLARGRILVDGFHRWQAHQRENITEIDAIDLGDIADIEIKKESYRRNKGHGVQLDTRDKKNGADDLYRCGVHDYDEIADLIGVTLKTAREYCRDARKDEVEQQRAAAWEMWLDCATQTEIAKAFDVPQTTISGWLTNSQSVGKSLEPPATRQHFDIWQFATSDKGSGQQSYFGAVPPQVLENLLWFFTDPGNVVVDLFAGSGTTVDVAKVMGRRVWASDIRGRHYSPHLPIHKHDATAGWPSRAPKKADLTFLDPPYWNQATGRYSAEPNELAEMDLQAFMSAWHAVCSAAMEHSRRIAFIISPTQQQDGTVIDHATDMLGVFTVANWRVERRIIVPYSTQQATGQQVTWARENKRMLKLYRDLIVVAP